MQTKEGLVEKGGHIYVEGGVLSSGMDWSRLTVKEAYLMGLLIAMQRFHGCRKSADPVCLGCQFSLWVQANQQYFLD